MLPKGESSSQEIRKHRKIIILFFSHTTLIIDIRIECDVSRSLTIFYVINNKSRNLQNRQVLHSRFL